MLEMSNKNSICLNCRKVFTNLENFRKHIQSKICFLETRLCAHGCGESFECKKSSNQIYIYGHYSKTKEAKERNSETHIGKKDSLETTKRRKIAAVIRPWRDQSGKNNGNYKPERNIRETRICDDICGCKGTFECFTWSDQRFINGHQNRGKNHPFFGKPGPMTGKHQTEEVIANQSKRMTGEGNPNFGESTWNRDLTGETDSRILSGENHPNFGKPPSPKCGIGKQGCRADLGDIWFRSTWDANVFRIFNYEGIPCEYECKRFLLTREDNSKSTYCPDIHIIGTTIWYEQKGYMNEQSKEKIRLFRKQYPEETLIVIDKEKYKRMTETYKDLIPNWE